MKAKNAKNEHKPIARHTQQQQQHVDTNMITLLLRRFRRSLSLLSCLLLSCKSITLDGKYNTLGIGNQSIFLFYTVIINIFLFRVIVFLNKPLL